MELIKIAQSIVQYLLGAVTAVIGLVLVLGFAGFIIIELFEIDPEPTILTTARILSGGRLVDFQEAFNYGADPSTRVCEVQRTNTDDDPFEEWVVYYQVDSVENDNLLAPCPDRSPRLVSIYDNDRGDPPIIYPYKLLLPDRDYLGAQGVSLEKYEIVPNVTSGQSNDPVPELFFFGENGGVRNQLAVFRYAQNSRPWENPTDRFPRYELIGFFTGNGGVEFQYNRANRGESKVVVRDYGGDLARSQMVVENVYTLQANGTFFSSPPQAASASAPTLGAPVQSTVNFAFGTPQDLLNTEYPEKIVLALLQSLDDTAADEATRPWQIEDLLAPDSEIAAQYRSGGLLPYLGLESGTTIERISVTALRYYPRVEELAAQQDAQLTNTEFRPTPTTSRVEVSFAVLKEQGGLFGSETQMQIPNLVFEVVLYNGQWKIRQRL